MFGLGYLVIPQSVVWKYTIVFAACGALDGLIRLGCWTVRYLIRRSKETAVLNKALQHEHANENQGVIS